MHRACHEYPASTTQEDAYWLGSMQPDFSAPLNPRNEAAALSRLIAAKAGLCKTELEPAELDELCAGYAQRVGCSALDGGPIGTACPDTSAEAALKKWCCERGMEAMVDPAYFALSSSSSGSESVAGENGAACAMPSPSGSAPPLRGLMASRDVKPGDAVVSVPLDMLISYDFIMATDLVGREKRVEMLEHLSRVKVRGRNAIIPVQLLHHFRREGCSRESPSSPKKPRLWSGPWWTVATTSQSSLRSGAHCRIASGRGSAPRSSC